MGPPPVAAAPPAAAAPPLIARDDGFDEFDIKSIEWDADHDQLMAHLDKFHPIIVARSLPTANTTTTTGPKAEDVDPDVPLVSRRPSLLDGSPPSNGPGGCDVTLVDRRGDDAHGEQQPKAQMDVVVPVGSSPPAAFNSSTTRTETLVEEDEDRNVPPPRYLLDEASGAAPLKGPTKTTKTTAPAGSPPKLRPTDESTDLSVRPSADRGSDETASAEPRSHPTSTFNDGAAAAAAAAAAAEDATCFDFALWPPDAANEDGFGGCKDRCSIAGWNADTDNSKNARPPSSKHDLDARKGERVDDVEENTTSDFCHEDDPCFDYAWPPPAFHQGVRSCKGRCSNGDWDMDTDNSNATPSSSKHDLNAACKGENVNVEEDALSAFCSGGDPCFDLGPRAANERLVGRKDHCLNSDWNIENDTNATPSSSCDLEVRKGGIFHVEEHALADRLSDEEFEDEGIEMALMDDEGSEMGALAPLDSEPHSTQDVFLADKVVVLLGKLGHGKTRLVNLLCGEAFASTMSCKSCTQVMQVGTSLKHGISIIDTPGFYSSTDIAAHIAQQKAALEGTPLNGIYAVVKWGRADEIAATLNCIMDFCGDDDVRIIVTHTDVAIQEEGFNEDETKGRLSELLDVPASRIEFVGKETPGDVVEGFIKSTLHEPRSFQVSKEQNAYMSSHSAGARQFDKDLHIVNAKIAAAERFCKQISERRTARATTGGGGAVAICTIEKFTRVMVEETKAAILDQAAGLPPGELNIVHAKVNVNLTIRLEKFASSIHPAIEDLKRGDRMSLSYYGNRSRSNTGVALVSRLGWSAQFVRTMSGDDGGHSTGPEWSVELLDKLGNRIPLESLPGIQTGGRKRGRLHEDRLSKGRPKHCQRKGLELCDRNATAETSRAAPNFIAACEGKDPEPEQSGIAQRAVPSSPLRFPPTPSLTRPIVHISPGFPPHPSQEDESASHHDSNVLDASREGEAESKRAMMILYSLIGCIGAVLAILVSRSDPDGDVPSSGQYIFG